MATENKSGAETGRRAAWQVVVWLTGAWAVVLAWVCIERNRLWLQDDAFITMRYARHLAEGHGPVWNVVGAPVEGFSSPLHMLLLTVLTLAHVDPIVAVRSIGFAFHAALVVFVWRYVRRTSGEMAGVLAGALVLASWPLLLWDLGGLDAVPFAALGAIGTLMTLRYIETGKRHDVLAGGLVLGLAGFMRPDGAVIAAAAFGACLLLGRETFTRRLGDVVLGGLLCLAVVLPWEIFRIAYFHEYLPNTFYAKVYGVPLAWRIHSGLTYWRTYLLKAPYLAPAVVLLAIVLLVKRRFSRLDVGLWICIVGYGAYLLDCGGDHMPGFRFMVLLIPLFAVVLVRALREVGAFDSPMAAAVVSCLLMAATARQLTVQMLDLREGDGSALLGTDVGQYMKAHWKPRSVVALNIAGAIPFHADELTYIDMLGLNDYSIARRHPVPMDGNWVHLIGHLKGDGADVFARRPDFIIMGGADGLPNEFSGTRYLGDHELLQMPGFAAQYKACRGTVELHEHAAGTVDFWYYQRRDAADLCANPN